MCGIAGIIDFQASKSNDLIRPLSTMQEALSHRGPDGNGVWFSEKFGAAMSHNRLSILDLSERGAQPMRTPCLRYTLVFNGEIYNAPALRLELTQAGTSFKGESDTEVLLYALSFWGVEQTLPKLVGMFAFALWDDQAGTLTLARDRIGIKPLYIARMSDKIAFASEPKSFKALPWFRPKTSQAALSALLQYAYIPDTLSIYENVSKLQPGSYITIDSRGNEEQNTYWSAREVAEYGSKNPFQGDESQAIDEVDRLLSEAVRMRMASDVPLGSFLSGGIDSAAVTALMVEASSAPIDTFSIGFEASNYNEAPYAAAVAAALGTNHHELTVTAQQAIDLIPSLPRIYCEPFADSSQIPTTLLARLARPSVTVALTGDGGDEVFGGYNRYTYAPRLHNRLRVLPHPARRLLAWLITRPSMQQYDSAFRALSRLLPKALTRRPAANTIGKLAQIIASRDLYEVYHQLTSTSSHTTGLLLSPTNQNNVLDPIDTLDPVRRMMLADMESYLVGDILTKVDRATMHSGLEARVPLLDHRVIEFCSTLPSTMMIGPSQSKKQLRAVLHRRLPKSLFDRPKQGFGMPVGEWLRGPLRPWAEALLDPQKLREAGNFDVTAIQKLWETHLRGRHGVTATLWTVLMFRAWQE